LKQKNSRILISVGKVVLKTLLDELTKPQKTTRRRRRDFSDTVKMAVLVMQGFRCSNCKNDLTVVDFHHIDGNRSNNNISNCVAFCPNCHAKLTRKFY